MLLEIAYYEVNFEIVYSEVIFYNLMRLPANIHQLY